MKKIWVHLNLEQMYEENIFEIRNHVVKYITEAKKKGVNCYELQLNQCSMNVNLAKFYNLPAEPIANKRQQIPTL